MRLPEDGIERIEIMKRIVEDPFPEVEAKLAELWPPLQVIHHYIYADLMGIPLSEVTDCSGSWQDPAKKREAQCYDDSLCEGAD
jgi:hypothetical protein